MRKRYKYPKTKALIKKLNPYIKHYHLAESIYREVLQDIEKRMRAATGIKDIEFFFCDNEIAGIGNAERTMELIYRGELEK